MSCCSWSMLVCFYFPGGPGFSSNIKEQTMLRVLMYLFENYSEHQARLISDQDILSGELQKAGFNQVEISDALVWLDGFQQFDEEAKTFPPMTSTNLRFYDLDEQEKMSDAARGLLLFLEQSGVLTPHMRELAIDRAMAMEDYVDLSQMKWVLLITLFYHPSEKKALDWMQDLVLHGDVMH